MLVRVFVCRLILSDPPVDLPHSLVCIVDGEAESVLEVAGEMLAVALADRFFRVVDESAGCRACSRNRMSRALRRSRVPDAVAKAVIRHGLVGVTLHLVCCRALRPPPVGTSPTSKGRWTARFRRAATSGPCGRLRRSTPPIRAYRAGRRAHPAAIHMSPLSTARRQTW